MTDFHLMRPEWLWTCCPPPSWPCCCGATAAAWAAGTKVIAPELLPFLVSPRRLARPNLLPLLLLGWLLAALAASGPAGSNCRNRYTRSRTPGAGAGLELLDEIGRPGPSRLDRARQKLQDLLAARKEGQTGLIAYAGDAHIVTP